MQSSASSNSPITTDRRVVCLTWILRILLGVVFLYSGFTKAVDPWGGQYKIADYFQAWNLTLSDGIYLTAGCLLSGIEFIMGTLLLTGAFRRLTAWAVLVFMSFMTVITLYIWIADPVSDCGCFGDAYILSNSATFWKNIVLLTVSSVLFVYSKRVRPLIHHRLQWLILIFTAAYIIAIQIVGYHIQPLVDYRPYPTDSNFKNAVDERDDTDQIKFIYEKDGIRQSFDLDSLPDETWTFVERISSDNTVNRPGLTIFDGEEDVTSEV
ncbi:MAG: DoxX family protein, partial [Muribaculaceae bacterium]|nr:DoxX family protein [Muribaculaceae bacterium]